MLLRQGDCIELMRDIPDGSIDMVLCDLPYGLTRNAWDVKIPFEALWEQYRRITKPNAAIVLHCQQPFTSELIQSNRAWFKYCWIWSKHQVSGFLNANKQPLRNCEEIAVFYRQQCTYHPQMTKGAMQHQRSKSRSPNYGAYGDQERISDLRYPTTLLDIPRPRFRGEHPTQKPAALLEYLIRTYTNEGDTVLDNCMGSGSTGVACTKTNRDFVGFELDPKWFEIAKKRIEEEETL